MIFIIPFGTFITFLIRFIFVISQVDYLQNLPEMRHDSFGLILQLLLAFNHQVPVHQFTNQLQGLVHYRNSQMSCPVRLTS